MIEAFLVAENNDHKKAKGVNRNVAVIITHNGYKHVLLNNKCLRSSSNKKSGTTAVSKDTNKKRWKHGKMQKKSKMRFIICCPK